jgi:hypothetical protein
MAAFAHASPRIAAYCVLTLLGADAASSSAQEQPPEPATEWVFEPLEEVTVRGRQLRRLRLKVMEAQRELYSLMNVYIKEPEFQITCERERPSMDQLDPQASTRIKQVVCRAGYMRDELNNIGYYSMRGVPYDASPTLLNKGKILAEKMTDAINASPELREAAERFDRLRREYQDVRKERSGD